MPRIGQEKVLLIADPQRDVHGALIAAIPSATVTAVNDYFDGIAELTANQYTTVVASAEPIERRPEAAVRQLRELAGRPPDPLRPALPRRPQSQDARVRRRRLPDHPR